MKSESYNRLAGYSAIIAGILVVIYSVAFVVLKNVLLYSFAQLIGGLLTSIALVALYESLKKDSSAFALVAVMLSVIAATGSMLHGGYDLANAIHSPDANAAALANLPSQIDPRGLLTFGMAGVGLFFFAWLITSGNQFPKALGYLGYILAILLVLTYLGRLIVLTPTSPLVLIPAALTGFLANPIFYIWLGAVLLKTK